VSEKIKTSTILQNKGPSFILDGIPWGKHEIFHGDAMGFHVEYFGIAMEHNVFHGNSMEYSTWNAMTSPWKILYVFAPMEFHRI